MLMLTLEHGIVICIIDKGIMENASGKNKLWKSMGMSLRDMVRKPGGFLTSRAFGLIYVRPSPGELPVCHRELMVDMCSCCTQAHT